MVDYDNSIYGIEKKQFPCMLCITNMLLHGIDVPKIYHDNSLLKDVHFPYGPVPENFDILLGKMAADHIEVVYAKDIQLDCQ